MSASFRVQGSNSKATADTHVHEEQPRGLVVYNDSLNHYSYDVKYLTNPSFGRNVNQDPTSITVTSTTIHDGGDTAGWTATNLSGSGFDFAGTGQVFAGLASIDATSSSHNNIASFATVTPVNPTSISYIRMRVYIESFDTRGTKDILVQFANGSVTQGVAISLKNYVDTSLLGTWQLADIPIGDFQLNVVEVDELRVETIDTGPGRAPGYHLDNIEYVSTSTGTDTYEFAWFPEYGEDYYVREFRMTGITAGKTDVDSSEFFAIPALTNGVELVFGLCGEIPVHDRR